MLQMVAKLQEIGHDECSQGTSVMSGNTSEWPTDLEVQSRVKKLRTSPSIETSEATAMSSHGFEASLQLAQSSTPPPEFEYDHSKATLSQTRLAAARQQGNDKSAQDMLRSMRQAAIGLQKARGEHPCPIWLPLDLSMFST